MFFLVFLIINIVCIQLLVSHSSAHLQLLEVHNNEGSEDDCQQPTWMYMVNSLKKKKKIKSFAGNAFIIYVEHLGETLNITRTFV